jgi:hypothetical protein
VRWWRVWQPGYLGELATDLIESAVELDVQGVDLLVAASANQLGPGIHRGRSVQMYGEKRCDAVAGGRQRRVKKV